MTDLEKQMAEALRGLMAGSEYKTLQDLAGWHSIAMPKAAALDAGRVALAKFDAQAAEQAAGGGEAVAHQLRQVRDSHHFAGLDWIKFRDLLSLAARMLEERPSVTCQTYGPGTAVPCAECNQTLVDVQELAELRAKAAGDGEAVPVAWRVWRGDSYELFFNEDAAKRRCECFARKGKPEPLYTHPAPAPVQQVGEREAVVVIGPDWQFLWASGDAIVDIVKRHDLKIGTRLYTRTALTQPALSDAEIDALRRGAERIQHFERMADQGYRPSLVFDDDGRWAVSYSGVAPVPDDGGHQTTAYITVEVQPDEWKPSVREAIDAALAARGGAK